MWKEASILLAAAILTLPLLSACESQKEQASVEELSDFATRYAAAWSNDDPVAFASFYAENGSFRINDGEPSVGREAIAATAGSFMAAFPDMLIRVVEVRETDEHVEFHWHWTGTNSGPGGTGNAVDLTGYEQWTLGADGLILETRGYMDDAEYQRQLYADPAESAE
jgi:steroid delta-isomerase-like uncharacterized protein